MTIFNKPEKYLDIISNTDFISKKNYHSGNSLAVVFLTKFCKVGCSHCIYNSKPKFGNETVLEEESELTLQGVENFIDFINKGRISYLLIAGGGEPFEREEFVYKILDETNSERNVIVTAGYWGNRSEKVTSVLYKINEIAHKQNKKIVLRVSVDFWHQSKIGSKAVYNIIKEYSKLEKKDKNFSLELHTLENDSTISKIFENEDSMKLSEVYRKVSSDDTNVEKKSTRGKFLQVKSPKGFSNIPIGEAKLFYPNLLVDLYGENLEKIKEPFYRDVLENQDGNYSVIQNQDGLFGLDYIVNFNGNISTWGNYQLNNISNLYTDNYNQIIDNIYNDIISYSFIDKKINFRENVVNMINNKAVERAAAINIRDYSGSYLLHEKNTALFYSIIVIKEYLKEGMIDKNILTRLPSELVELIGKNIDEIKCEYQESNYDIFEQYKNDYTMTKEDWMDLFLLVSLGHYEVDENKIKENILYFNLKFDENYDSLESIKKNIDMMTITPRLIERLTFQPKYVKNYLNSLKKERVKIENKA